MTILSGIESVLAEVDTLTAKVMRHARLWAAEVDLSKQQVHLLKTLYCKKRATVSELADDLFLSASATTIAVNRLTREGFIVRARDEADRRLVWLELSEEACAKVKQLQQQREKLMMQLLSCLSEEEGEQLLALLRKMTSALDEENKEGKEGKTGEAEKRGETI
ncbi:MarR family winged helix-turn-helix transcriptional regulator [Paenibacillus cremeus]|uniref:MarR family transcriptional regulator n=1 Tax=Paenibacillus cremeus TaxID=2163881 RepID=A0A559JK92_9BACL|nr:MarR family transcriptional regulator [Paenibacillus cremeus]TVY00292.1 MarR family transcriptional regulator [Paenibacillus cremeus]